MNILKTKIPWYQHMKLNWKLHKIMINVKWNLGILRKFWETSEILGIF